jgi:hypothetical protein
MARTIHATGLADNMNNLQIGKMYLVKEFFWFVFPTKELAGDVRGTRGRASTCADARWWAAHNAKWLSQEFKCNVGVVEPNTCVVLLEQDKVYFKVLDSNGNIGWIYCCDDFSCYFEFVKE